VKVEVTSINPMDVLFRQGAGQWAGITLPVILGYDVSPIFNRYTMRNLFPHIETETIGRNVPYTTLD